MEKFDHKEYRDDLAKDLKYLRKNDGKELAEKVLEVSQDTDKYKESQIKHWLENFKNNQDKKEKAEKKERIKSISPINGKILDIITSDGPHERDVLNVLMESSFNAVTDKLTREPISEEDILNCLWEGGGHPNSTLSLLRSFVIEGLVPREKAVSSIREKIESGDTTKAVTYALFAGYNFEEFKKSDIEEALRQFLTKNRSILEVIKGSPTSYDYFNQVVKEKFGLGSNVNNEEADKILSIMLTEARKMDLPQS